MDTHPYQHLETQAGRLEYTFVHRTPRSGEPVLVFLHEGLGCIRMWRDFPATLAACLDMPGLVYSRAGYGGSAPITLPRPITYQEDEAQGPLFEILDQLNIEKTVLIGHSDGGTIALIHAGLDMSGRTRGAVTMAAHVFNEDICVAGIREAREIWETTDLRAKLARYHGDNVDTAFFGWNDTWQRDDYRHWNVEKYLPDISCPLLVIQGEDDHYGSVAQVDAIIKGAGGPAQKQMLPDCAHNPQFEQPAPTTDAISRFVANLDLRA
jgi:pimeloyl-ACP methyl ester carboxylesterase